MAAWNRDRPRPERCPLPAAARQQRRPRRPDRAFHCHQRRGTYGRPDDLLARLSAFRRVNGIGIPSSSPGLCDSTTKFIWAAFGVAPTDEQGRRTKSYVLQVQSRTPHRTALTNIYACQNTTIGEIADKLRGWAPGCFDHPVIDLEGSFDFTLR
jgi:hypothetical protein